MYYVNAPPSERELTIKRFIDEIYTELPFYGCRRISHEIFTRQVMAVLCLSINCLGISLLLSTFWLTVLSGSSFLALLPTRVVQNLIMIPAQFIALRLIKIPIGVYMDKVKIYASNS
jgi:hypothetical protein